MVTHGPRTFQEYLDEERRRWRIAQGLPPEPPLPPMPGLLAVPTGTAEPPPPTPAERQTFQDFVAQQEMAEWQARREKTRQAFQWSPITPGMVEKLPGWLQPVGRGVQEMLTPGQIALSASIAGVGPGLVRGATGPIAGMLAPIVKGSFLKRFLAEEAVGAGAVAGATEAARLTETAPTPVRVGASLAAGLAGGMAGIGAMRAAPAVGRAAQRGAGDVLVATGAPGAALRVLGKPQVAGAAAREPWQMTKAEFTTGLTGTRLRISSEGHELRVTQAIAEGKPVPPEVLADYPDLVTKATAPITERPLPARGPIEPIRPPVAAAGWETGAPRPFTFDPNSTVNQGRFRLLPPIKGGSYITRQSGTPGVSYIIEIKTNAIQAVRFNKKLMPEAKAAEWWEANAARLGRETPVGARAVPGSVGQIALEPEVVPTGAQTAAPQGDLLPGAAAPSGGPPGRPPGEPPVTTGGVPPGEPPRPTPEEANAALGRLTQFIHSPESADLSDLTIQVRQKQLSERLGHLQDRTEALLGQGMPFEDAMKQAQGETMSGAFDRPFASLSEVMADQFRDSAFARVYEVLKNEPLERMSTTEALTNALLGKGIPRIPGTTGGSAYTRLSRVFPPEVMAILEKDRPLAQKFEDVLLQSGEKYKFTTPQGPWPPPFEMMGEQLPVGTGGQIARTRMTPLEVTPGEQFQMGLPGGRLERPPGITERISVPTPELRGQQPSLGLPGGQSEGISATRPQPLSPSEMFDLQTFGMERPQGVSMPRYEAPIEAAIKMPSLMPVKNQHIFVRAAKQLALTALDTANFLRSNKAGFDFSWWRQQTWLIAGHLGSFYKANIAAWKGMWDKSFAQSVEKSFKEDLFYYQHYEQAGYDFLRPLEQKGVPVWQREETYAVLGGERPIAKFAEKLPWIRLPQRAFVTGTNVMNWDIFRGYVDNVYRMNEKIASGAVKLKPGEAFDVAKSIENHAKMLADMTGRAKLGPLKEMTGAINAGFFSMRLNLGRLLMPRHLLSADPLVRKEAWKNIVLTVASISSVELAGQKMGLWRVEVDPRSPNVGTLQIGPIRFDPWGGMKKYAVLYARLLTQELKSGKTGQVYPIDIYGTAGRFVAGMGSPGASILSEFLTGETFVGEDVDYKSVKQWADRVAPMNLADMYDAVNESNSYLGLLVGIPSSLGVGVVSYGALEAKWRDDFAAYRDIPSNDAERQAKYAASKTWEERALYAWSRSEYRERNPEVDAKLFIMGQTTSLQSLEARRIVVQLMKENRIDVKDIKSLEEEQYEPWSRTTLRRWFEQQLGTPGVERWPHKPVAGARGLSGFIRYPSPTEARGLSGFIRYPSPTGAR